MFSEQVLDHFQNPRNAGELAEATVKVRLENPVCGDIVELALLMKDGRVEKAMFRAKGCVPSVACASVLTTLIEGAELSRLQGLRREDLLAQLGELPQTSVHAAQLAIDVLRKALHVYSEQQRVRSANA